MRYRTGREWRRCVPGTSRAQWTDSIKILGSGRRTGHISWRGGARFAVYVIRNFRPNRSVRCRTPQRRHIVPEKDRAKRSEHLRHPIDAAIMFTALWVLA